MDQIVNNELMHFAHRLADRAGEVILPHFRQRGDVVDKGQDAFDPVTDADRGAEAAMRAMIAAEYPDHGILGEEFDDRPGSSPYRWVLDPIDGTKAFICGLPVWGTLIGLTYEGRPVLGLMDQPYVGERFWGSAEGARFRNAHGERPLRTRRCGALSEATLAATTPDMFRGDEPARFASLSKACRLTRYGGDCYFYCLLAMGFIDVVAEASLKPVDIVPLVPIIEGAGGMVSSWDGGGGSVSGGQVLVVGDPSLQEAALRALARPPAP